MVLRGSPESVRGDQWLLQISLEPIFTTASPLSLCLPSAAHLFWQWSHNLICALCLNKVAWVQINSNWCCQCRNIAKILGALVNIQHGRQPHHPLRFLQWGQHCAILLLCSLFLSQKAHFWRPYQIQKHILMKRLEPWCNPQKLPPWLKKNVKIWLVMGLDCVDEDIFRDIWVDCDLQDSLLTKF